METNEIKLGDPKAATDRQMLLMAYGALQACNSDNSINIVPKGIPMVVAVLNEYLFPMEPPETEPEPSHQGRLP